VKSIVRHSLFVFPLIALFGIAFALITARLDDKNASRQALLEALDRQIALTAKTPKEATLSGALPEFNGERLERAIDAANDHYERQIAPLAAPIELENGAIGKLESANKLWKALQARARQIAATKTTITKESETVLQLAPQLKEATLELSQMMENRRVPWQTVQDSRKQIDLAERLVFIASAYMADGGAARYDELTRAINAYSQTLYGFANDEKLQASVQALVSTNQLFWKGYQESLTKAIEGRRQIIKDTAEIYQETEALSAELSAAKTEIVGANAAFFFAMRVAQIALALLIAASIGYAICLFMPFRKETLIARAPQNMRPKELFDDETSITRGGAAASETRR
jgi:hypothetical protein